MSAGARTLALALRRFLAYALDVVMAFAALAAPQFAAARLLGFPSWERLGRNPYLVEAWVLATVSLPTWAYFTLADSSRARGTLGKRLLGLCVVGRGGRRIGRRTALGRTALKLLPWELTHISIIVPNPLTLPGSEMAPSQLAGLVAANALIVAYVVGLVALGGTRALHDLPFGTRVTARQ